MRRSSLRFALCGAVAMMPVTAAAQQTEATLELSGQRLRYGDTLTANAGSLTPALRVESPRGSFGASATITQFQSGGTSLYGTAAGSLFTARRGPFFGELLANAAASRHDAGSTSSKVLGLARLHVAGHNGGIWGGGGAGRAADGNSSRNVRQAELGAWTQLAAATLFATVTPTRIGSDVTYTDAELRASLQSRRADGWASLGFRSGDRVTISSADQRAWVGGGAAFWVLPSAALTISAGSYAPDYAQRFPGGTFVSVGVRVGRWIRMPSVEDLVGPQMQPAAAGITAFDTRHEGGRVVLRLRAAGAQSVEVSGDFTQWEPVAMTRRADDWWSLSLALAAGPYEFNVRMNGEPWTVPPRTTTVRDEFGGVSAVLVVP